MQTTTPTAARHHRAGHDHPVAAAARATHPRAIAAAQAPASATAFATAAACATAVGAALAVLTLLLLAPPAAAEITEDCILEGTVDMRTARELGQPIYVKFREARNGTEAACSMNRRSNSRRVRFISAPNTEALQNVNARDGETVRYRYLERDNQYGYWQLLDGGS